MLKRNFYKVIIIVSGILLAFVILMQINVTRGFLSYSNNMMDRWLHSNIHNLNSYLENSRQYSINAAMILAEDPEIIRVIREKDTPEAIRLFTKALDKHFVNFFTITDSEGIVIARTHEPQYYGDSIIGQSNIYNALNGNISSYYEEGTFVKISVRTGVPVYDDDGSIIGVISAGFRLDTLDVVEELSKLLDAEVSVFYGTELMATSITGSYDLLVTGEKLDHNIERILFEEQNEHTCEIVVNDTRYISYFKPLINAKGETLAIIFMGISAEDLYHETGDVLRRIAITAVIGVLLTSILVGAMWKIRKSEVVNELQLTKLNLMSGAIGIASWDMDVIMGDPVNPENEFRWSQEFRHALGYTDIIDFPDLLCSWSDCIHPDDKDRVSKAFEDHILDVTGRTPYDIQYRMMMKTGEYRFFRDFGNTLRDKNGVPLKVAGAIIDITDDVELREAIEKQASVLQTTIDSIPDLIFCKDVNSIYTLCNKHLEEYFNLDNNFLIGKDDYIGLKLPKEIAEGHISADRIVINEGKTISVEEWVPSYDGTLRLFETFKAPLIHKDGESIGLVGVARDITERKRMEEEALAATKAKSEFLATMSHEIRTPLNAILGITEIQLFNEKLDPDAKAALRKIYGSGDMLLGLINDILDLSKIESGKLELIISNYEIANLISDTAQINVMRIGSKEIVFELEIDENLPANLSGDELRVKQILNNVLSNAIKYTDEGNVTFSITTQPNKSDSAKSDDDSIVNLVFSVKDTGQGMTPEQLEKLFDEYSRFNLEANRSTEGAGLGMNITNNLIRMMDGTIEIESEFGVGSTVTVHLPQGRVDDKLLGKEIVENLLKFRLNDNSQISRSQITREPMPYGSVLVVDDVETNIFVATGLLLPYKLIVDSVDSGFGAIDKVKEGNVYDIIFMDHMMPKMDGIEATKIIREMGYSEPIVALTANAVVGQMAIFLENGFNDFISKPIDVRQMNVVLNKFIRDKQPPEVIEEARKQAKLDAQNAALDEIPEDMTAKYTEFFLRDASKTLDILEEFLAKGEPYSDEDMQTYVIFTHGIKSALANIGRDELSFDAKNLEMMGKDRNIEVILANTKPFLEALRAVVIELKPSDDDVDDGAVDEDPEYLREKLQDLAAACDEYDQATAETLLAVLNERTWSKETRVLLGKVNEFLFTCEFESIVDAINEFMDK